MTRPLLEDAERFVVGLAATPAQRELFARAFSSLKVRMERHRVSLSHLDCVRIPALVYAAAGGTGDIAGLQRAMLIEFIGISLWDDAIDGDLGDEWQDVHPTEVTLTAIALISGVGTLALRALALPDAVIGRLFDALSRAFIAAAAGQQLDVSLARTASVDSRPYEEAMRNKSGALVALYAELSALAAGASADMAQAYAEVGAAVGMVLQLRNDWQDLFGESWSRDLAAGVRTLPLVLHLERLDETARLEFAPLLERAKRERDAQAEVRARIAATSSPKACIMLWDAWIGRAKEALARANPQGSTGVQLMHLIESLAFRAADG